MAMSATGPGSRGNDGRRRRTFGSCAGLAAECLPTANTISDPPFGAQPRGALRPDQLGVAGTGSPLREPWRREDWQWIAKPSGYIPDMDHPRRRSRKGPNIAWGVAFGCLMITIAARAPFLPFHGTRWDIALWAVQGILMALVAVLVWWERRGKADQSGVAESCRHDREHPGRR
ncbi:hypothetical protein GCM10009682_01050 [Luedemannella flava]|uniref:DUF2631 domain-containing protein n=1 Tax=Luedemannella flava TaxID=349316 RepID=A0ABN2LDE3_9ACTN